MAQVNEEGSRCGIDRRHSWRTNAGHGTRWPYMALKETLPLRQRDEKAHAHERLRVGRPIRPSRSPHPIHQGRPPENQTIQDREDQEIFDRPA